MGTIFSISVPCRTTVHISKKQSLSLYKVVSIKYKDQVHHNDELCRAKQQDVLFDLF
uniref:Uncharacterized protein n=1 Tax=Anguilla anguilla TaxID=7936 RepID=A0A0E9QGB6_ANGAN